MNSRAPTRWTDGSMERLVAKRYAAERRFKFFGLAAVSLSVAFLAFLLITMAWKGAGGFTRTEIELTIDFPRSDLMLDPAALRGPESAQAIGGAGLDTLLEQAAVAQFGRMPCSIPRGFESPPFPPLPPIALICASCGVLAA